MRQVQLILSIMASLFLLIVTSCKGDEPGLILNPSAGTIGNVLKVVCTDWNTNKMGVEEKMDSYEMKKIDDGDNLIYSLDDNSCMISYVFKDDKLMGSSVIVNKDNGDIDNGSLFSNLKYLGWIDEARVYEDGDKNLFVSYWSEISNTDFYAIGYSPIESSLFTLIEPIEINTGEVLSNEPFTAKVKGTISGLETELEGGFVYGQSPDLSIEKDHVVKGLLSNGDFELDLKGLVNNTTYYYQAYAMDNNNRVYLGEVKSFDTVEKIFYSINGKTFEMITVEGGPFGDFSIMQTELAPSDIICICGVSIERSLDNNGDDKISVYECSTVLDEIFKLTGVNWRVPTTIEWRYAANGGEYEEDFQFSGSNLIEEVAWYKENSNGGPHGPAEKNPNALGLFDMSGNYAECVNDGQINKDGTLNARLSWQIGDTACGGGWFSSKEQCQINKTIKSELSRYSVDGSKCTCRFIYSRRQ